MLAPLHLKCQACGHDMITVDLPQGWQSMNTRLRDRDTVIRCAKCGRIDKYAGTVEAADPETGRRCWRTA